MRARAIVLRGGGVLIALTALWLATARPLSMLVDRIHTLPVAALSASPLGWNGTYLQVGPQVLGLGGPAPAYAQVVDFRVDGAGRLIAVIGGQALTLGPRAGFILGDDGPIPAFAAESGDRASLTVTRSLLAWPVFETNFMTGRSPTWRRGVHQRLTWTKRSGARLDMRWRSEQGYYGRDGWLWSSGADDSIGLIQARITPALKPQP